MFFDNEKYFDFVELCRKHDINIPIIPGLKPISTQTIIFITTQISFKSSE